MDTMEMLHVVEAWSGIFPAFPDGTIRTSRQNTMVWMVKKVQNLHVVFGLRRCRRGRLVEEILTFDLTVKTTADQLRGFHKENHPSCFGILFWKVRKRILDGEAFVPAATAVLAEVSSQIDQGDLFLTNLVRRLEIPGTSISILRTVPGGLAGGKK